MGVERPLLFVDVDGVLHLWEATVPHDRVRVGTGMPLRIPTGAREHLRALAESFELVWATAWTTDAHPAFREPLGLPEIPWPVLEWSTYKLPAIETFAGERPWAWIDDEIAYELERLGRTDAGPNLLVPTQLGVGLTAAHVQTLLAFAAGAA